VFAALVLVAAGCTPVGKTSQAGGGLELVQTKCTLCHPVDRINNANHDLAGWNQTIARMRGKGAQVTDAEATQIAEYLASSGARK
jgi:cytochrome c5